jgi:hypothetical protein
MLVVRRYIHPVINTTLIVPGQPGRIGIALAKVMSP